jgi:hypothetical protein
VWLTHAYMTPRQTLVVIVSQLNFEALAVRMVLAHPRATFHPCTCGLCGGAVAVAAALIGYDDVEVAIETTMRMRQSWTTTSSTPTRDYVGSLLQLFFHCSACLVVTIHDLLVVCILRWHGRSSATTTENVISSGSKIPSEAILGPLLIYRCW